MSANNTTADLLSYMSKELLKVAELNSVLDQFGWKDKSSLIKGSELANDASQVGYKFKFTTLPISSNWIRVVRNDNWDLGGFDFEDATENPRLETRELTARDRLEIESLELF